MDFQYIECVNIIDVDEIVDIEYKTYNHPWTKKHFINDINNSCSMNYMYKRNGKILGYLFGYLIKSEFHLNKITVTANERRKKIGRVLLNFYLKQLLFKNVKCIQLEVSSLNLVAQKFYKSFNFKHVGTRTDYYSKNEHALLYTLDFKWLNGLDVNQIK